MSYGSTDVEQIGGDSPEGVSLGKATTDLVGLYGLSVAQRSTVTMTAVAATGATSTAGSVGFATAAQVDSLVTQANEIASTLKAYGLHS